MFSEEKKEFKVGDVIITKNCFNTYKRTVTRVTKLHAICETVRKDGTKYTSKFKKEYILYKNDQKQENCGKAHLTPVPRIDWNTNEYYVFPSEMKFNLDIKEQ